MIDCHRLITPGIESLSDSITSRYLGAEKLSSKQTHISIKMATLSIASLLSFFSDEKKSIKKGENHFKSDHVEAISYQRKVFYGEKCTQV